MFKCKVIGSVTSTVKHVSLDGVKLLVVRVEGEGGGVCIVMDSVGAGVGDEIIIVNDGKLISEILQTRTSPIVWCTLGIIDPVAGASEA
ncbi:MAG: ethanolamine utilization protein EutN [Planctomycetaceae bacterium]|nr:ethanolamine utilization protein EutN [Planctomycetaceae bacterium]